MKRGAWGAALKSKKKPDQPISWTEKRWNPIIGCTKVSSGCRNCWAERMARFHYHDLFPDGWNGKAYPFPERLDQPSRWKKPCMVAVALMGDLFHADIPDPFIDKVFKAMAHAPRHTFQVLTKRPERMLQILPTIRGHYPDRLDHVWLGVSVEDQATADERIPILLQVLSAVRFVSIEPMLEPIELNNLNLFNHVIPKLTGSRLNNIKRIENYPKHIPLNSLDGWNPGGDEIPPLNWVIVGGESGPGSRPMHPDWVRSVRDQCRKAGVPFHFKQWGEWASGVPSVSNKSVYISARDGKTSDMPAAVRLRKSGNAVMEVEARADMALMVKVGKKKAGRRLDGKEYLEFPQ